MPLLSLTSLAAVLVHMLTLCGLSVLLESRLVRRLAAGAMPPGAKRRAHPVDVDDSDDDVQVLAEEPAHLRRPSNRDHPIVLDDDDDEPGQPVAGPSAPRAKRARTSAADDIQEVKPYHVPGQHDAGPSGDLPPERTAANLVAIVLSILPDLDGDWARAQLLVIVQSGEIENAPNIVIEQALNMDSYPRAESSSSAPKLDYKSADFNKAQRSGDRYRTRSLETLAECFPKIPIDHIRAVFNATASELLVPAYVVLKQHLRAKPPPFNILRQGRVYKGKAYSSSPSFVAALAVAVAGPSKDELDLERDYLAAMIERDEMTENAEAARLYEEEAAKAAKDIERDEAIAAGTAIQCGCCYDDYLLEEMGQCVDGHLFCSMCLVKHTETKLGGQQIDITCMDVSGCRADFAAPELRRILPPKLLGLYERLKQAHDLELAGLAGLRNCPFCPFAMVIDNPDEKLFRCQNDECLQVTCLQCKKPDHIPKSCAEMEADAKLDHRHVVEEAMSAALMRRCPNCTKPYFKDDGCNKMVCSACGTLSCYICQNVIKGYDHFMQQPGRADISKPGACSLWDNPNRTDAQLVLEARDAAQVAARAAAEAQGLDLGAGDLVQAPAAAPPRAIYPVARAIPAGLAEQAELAHRLLQRYADAGIPRVHALQARLREAGVVPGQPVPPFMLGHGGAAMPQARAAALAAFQARPGQVPAAAPAQGPLPPAVAAPPAAPVLAAPVRPAVRPWPGPAAAPVAAGAVPNEPPPPYDEAIRARVGAAGRGPGRGRPQGLPGVYGVGRLPYAQNGYLYDGNGLMPGPVAAPVRHVHFVGLQVPPVQPAGVAVAERPRFEPAGFAVDVRRRVQPVAAARPRRRVVRFAVVPDAVPMPAAPPALPVRAPDALGAMWDADWDQLYQ